MLFESRKIANTAILFHLIAKRNILVCPKEHRVPSAHLVRFLNKSKFFHSENITMVHTNDLFQTSKIPSRKSKIGKKFHFLKKGSKIFVNLCQEQYVN